MSLSPGGTWSPPAASTRTVTTASSRNGLSMITYESYPGAVLARAKSHLEPGCWLHRDVAPPAEGLRTVRLLAVGSPKASTVTGLVAVPVAVSGRAIAPGNRSWARRIRHPPRPAARRPPPATPAGSPGGPPAGPGPPTGPRAPKQERRGPIRGPTPDPIRGPRRERARRAPIPAAPIPGPARGDASRGARGAGGDPARGPGHAGAPPGHG